MVYLFEEKLLKGQILSRSYPIDSMAAVIKSSESTQIVLSFPQAKDLRIEGLNKRQASLLIEFI